MGSPKLLLPWGHTSILGHLIRQCQTLGPAQVSIVIANEAVELRQELDRLGFSPKNRIVNDAPERGMFSSIQCAARWNGWSELITHWVILLGDQPHLEPSTLRQLSNFAAKNWQKVCQPLRGSRWCHPVVLPKATFCQLPSSKANTLREFLAGCERAGFECRDPGLEKDIDTPEDYQKALEGSSKENSPVGR
jgi:CTP:molybdopterin cytidylyltransferase MocA